MVLLDTVVASLLLISVFVGMWRGLLFELISLSGWVVALLLAYGFAAELMGRLPWLSEADPTWRYMATFVLLFLAGMFGMGLVASLVRSMVKATGLRPVDRGLGAVYGFLRGALLLVVAGIAVHLLSLTGSPWWRDSVSANVVNAALRELKPTLPPKLASYLP